MNSVILGIDPGTVVMGYGLIAANNNDIALIEMGVLHLAKYKDHAERLHRIFAKTESLIKAHKPESMAIEAPFFGKNVQSMLKLGRAQGVAMAAGMTNGLLAIEYAPRKVKQSVTGRGDASKEQVWEIIKQVLHLQADDFGYLDATDAIAVAICHHYQNRSPLKEIERDSSGSFIKTGKKKKETWGAFIAANPERIKLQ